MQIQLMADGGADIPQQLVEKYQIEIVPLYLHFTDGEYKTGVGLDLDNFHKKVATLNEVPKSSAPSPNDFYEAFKKVPTTKPILMLSLSKELSTTYANAEIAKEMLLAEEPEREIAIINTKSASGAVALMLHQVQQKIETGMSFEQLVDYAEKCADETATLFVLRTLENLVRGGRVSKVTGRIAKTLNIKLLMRASDKGEIEVTEKIRGEKKSVARFIDQIGEYTKNFEDKSLFMTHCNDESRASSILNEIKKKYPFKETFLSDVGPIIATHGGEGTLVIAFLKE